MRRHTLLLFIVILGATALATAQEEEPPAKQPPDAVPVTISRESREHQIFGPITGVWSSVEVEAQRVQEPALTQGIAADLCSDAPRLAMETFGNAGDVSTVNDMTSSPSDPQLSCMWGSPSNPRGYRTVWYKFRAPVSGFLRVKTGFNPSDFSDSYDTVLALYHSNDSTCGTLAMLKCNDDSEGFLSEVSQFVIEGQWYYIEVADWQFSSQAADTLRLAVALEEGDSFWDPVDELWEDARSRHMVVTDGRYVYVIGGEKVVYPNPERDASNQRYDPEADTWERLWPIPIQDEAYSRTSAAYFDGHIYVPSGYAGNNQQYKGTHWVYSIADDFWYEGTSVPWSTASPSGQPYAWYEAVASPRDSGYFITGGLLSGDPDPAFPFDGEPTGRLLLYKPDSSGITGNWLTNLPDMSVPRYAHVAALLNTPQGRAVCVVGGVSQDPNVEDQAVVLGTGECYNVATATWTPLPAMNFARFSAGSAVGPDGRWYVFGGLNAQGNHVPHTEVYNPATNTWRVLDSRYSLRRPGRSWPRGVFVDSTLWVFGGEQVREDGIRVIPLIERLLIPTRSALLPIIKGGDRVSIEPNNALDDAYPIGLNQEVWNSFTESDDFFDFYRFRVTEPGRYQVTLTHIPSERDYDVFVYNSDKMTVGDSQNIGTLDEHAVTHPLTPGIYYALALRTFGQPTTDAYRLVVSRHSD